MSIRHKPIEYYPALKNEFYISFIDVRSLLSAIGVMELGMVRLDSSNNNVFTIDCPLFAAFSIWLWPLTTAGVWKRGQRELK